MAASQPLFSYFLVTGASRGLGYEFVKQFSEKQASKVIACCRDLKTSQDLIKLQAANPQV